jgi:hypothetical protein
MCATWQLCSEIAPHLVHKIIGVGVEKMLRTATSDVDRVVHHNIEMTKTADCGLNRGHKCIAIQKIQRNLHCTLAERFNRCCGRRQTAR